MKITKILLICFICLCCLVKVGHIHDFTSSLVIQSKIIIDGVPMIDFNVKKPITDEKVLQLLANYPDLRESILNAEISIPLINGFIPQGIVVINSNILVTGYFESHESSLVYVLNEYGDIVNEVKLDTNSHVGAIAYDEVNSLIWIPDNDGRLSAYNKDDFFDKTEVSAKYSYSGLGMELTDYKDSRKKHIAYLCVDDKYLYFGNFFINSSCLVKKYEIHTNRSMVDLEYVNSFYLPSKTQSLTFIEKDDKKYMLISRSYGRSNSSQIYVYNYDEEISDYNDLEIKKMDFPPMLEQIGINNDYLYLLFESGAMKYSNCLEKMEVIPILSVDGIISEDR